MKVPGTYKLRCLWVIAGFFISFSVPPAHAVTPYWKLMVSEPLGLSAGGGLRFDGGGSMDPFIDVDAGTGGGRVGIGLDGLGDGFGFGLRGSLMRTWLEPIDVDKNQTYLGLDIMLGYDQLSLQLGSYYRIQGDGGSADEWLTTIGFGFRM